MFARIRAYGSQAGLFEYSEGYRTREVSSFTCQHCNFVMAVPHGADPSEIGGLCKHCLGLICPKCVRLGGCEPIEVKIDRMENQRRFVEDVRGN